MTWAYSQTSGVIRHNMIDVGSGYSGFGEGKNNPAMEAVENYGPIPQGRYLIGKAYDHPHLGPCVMNLTPTKGTTAFGRTDFRIHGDNLSHDASHGCIILNHDIREMLNNVAGGHDLQRLDEFVVRRLVVVPSRQLVALETDLAAEESVPRG